MTVDYAARFASWGQNLRDVYAAAVAKLGPKLDRPAAEKAGADYVRQLKVYQAQVCRMANTYARLSRLPLTPDSLAARKALNAALTLHTNRMRDYMTGLVAGSPTHAEGIAIDCPDVVGVLVVDDLIVIGAVTIIFAGACWAAATISSCIADTQAATSSADEWDAYYKAKAANPNAAIAAPKSDGHRGPNGGEESPWGMAAKAFVGVAVIGGVAMVGSAWLKSRSAS